MTSDVTKTVRRQLIYILGAGRSGSTLLDLLLGEHEEIFSLGEFTNLPAYLRLDWVCGCGEKINQCKFWNEIVSELDQDDQQLLSDIRSLTPLKNKLQKFAQLFIPLKINTRIKSHHKLERRLFEKIAQKKMATWLLDSSKDFSRLQYLLEDKVNTIKVIYLVRDGRGYVNSRKKPPKLATLHSEKRQGIPVWRSSWDWVKTNLCCLYIVGRLNNNDKMMVRYEDLATNPAQALNKIYDFLGLPYDEKPLELKDRTHHNVGGNRMRFRKNQKISLDDSWRTGLTRKEKIIFAIIGGILNSFLRRMECSSGKNRALNVSSVSSRN